jgi:hypothetical protein
MDSLNTRHNHQLLWSEIFIVILHEGHGNFSRFHPGWPTGTGTSMHYTQSTAEIPGHRDESGTVDSRAVEWCVCPGAWTEGTNLATDRAEILSHER